MEQNGLIHHSMTLAESQQLQALETVIDQGLRAFIDVGNALLEIRDARLYRQEFGTFEDYCRERWGFTRMHASRLIGAAEVVTNVTDRLQIAPPANIEQTRPLTVLEPEQQREVWQRAVETAPNGKVTAAHVQTVVNEYRTPEPVLADVKSVNFAQLSVIRTDEMLDIVNDRDAARLKMWARADYSFVQGYIAQYPSVTWAARDNQFWNLPALAMAAD